VAELLGLVVEPEDQVGPEGLGEPTEGGDARRVLSYSDAKGVMRPFDSRPR
jgi:hypothetical protein